MGGINFLPVKKLDVGDGVFFSFCMSIGVMAVGLVVSFGCATWGSLAFKTLPSFEPYAMLGGASWMLGFAMAVAAGCMMGYTFDPSTDLAHRSGHSGDQMDYVWSNFTGTLLMAIVALVVYVTIRRRKSFVRRAVV